MYSGQQIFDFDNPKFENLPFDLAKFLRPEDTNFTMVILLNSVKFEFSAKVWSWKYSKFDQKSKLRINIMEKIVSI